jgi:amidase
MKTEDYCNWSAAEIVRAVSAGETTCREVTDACLRRIDEVNPVVLAVVEIDPDGALQAADEADASIRRGEPLGPLHGVPVVTKPSVDQRGSATMNGVAAFKDRIAGADNPTIANLRKAGAIIVGRTNTPSFSWRWFTGNEVHGETTNPWNANVTAGGSSGGAAVAVSVGIVPIAHGTDVAGSNRYPAYACGVLGMRPTQGRIPGFDATAPAERSPFYQLLWTQGPLARTVDDMRSALRAMTGHTPLDPWSVPVPLELGPTVPCRVSMVRSVPWADVDPTVSDEVDRAARQLEAAGYEIVEVCPPGLEQFLGVFDAMLWEASRGFFRTAAQLGDAAMRTVAESLVSLAAGLDADDYLRLFGLRTSLIRQWSLFLEEHPLLLMPVSWRKPFPANYDQGGHDAVVEVLTAMAPQVAGSVCGLPALAAPTSVGPDGPMGVQLLAGRFREDRCLNAAEVFVPDPQALLAPTNPSEELTCTAG